MSTRVPTKSYAFTTPIRSGSTTSNLGLSAPGVARASPGRSGVGNALASVACGRELACTSTVMFVVAWKELDGHLLVELAVHTLGQINGPHATAPQQISQPVRSASHVLRFKASQRALGSLADVSLERDAGARIERHQGFHFDARRLIDAAFGEIPGTAFRGQVRYFME